MTPYRSMFLTDGRGYADDGRAWWEEDHKYSDGSEAEEGGKGTEVNSVATEL